MHKLCKGETMKFFKNILIIYMCLAVSLLTCGCGDDFDEAQVAFSTVSGISTFDPQLASTDAELSIASNCFEGLMTKNQSGEIVLGGAVQSYEKNGLVYTFKIKNGLVYSDGETNLTAEDFEFGISRAVLKQTGSPFVSLLFSIKNAKAINEDKMDIGSLGVYADEKDNTLSIILERDDPAFLETLAKPLTAPCDEAFFNSTAGKYGLKSKYIISNGAFSIEYYNTDTKTAIIKRSPEYVGENGAIPSSVTVNYDETYDSIYADFGAKEIDIGTIDCAHLTSLEELGNKANLYYNTNYCLYISNSLVSEYGNQLNKALTFAIDNGAITSNITDFYGNVNGIIPDINTFNGKEYRAQVGNAQLNAFDVQKAESLLGSYDQASEVLNGLSIYYPDGDSRLELISNLIAQGWQKDLNIFINSAKSDANSIASKIKTGEIKIGVITVSSESGEALPSFNCLNNLDICEKANVQTASELFKLEQQLISDGTLYPLLSIPTAIVFTNNVEEITTSKDGKTIDFRFIKKS